MSRKEEYELFLQSDFWADIRIECFSKKIIHTPQKWWPGIYEGKPKPEPKKKQQPIDFTKLPKKIQKQLFNDSRIAIRAAKAWERAKEATIEKGINICGRY